MDTEMCSIIALQITFHTYFLKLSQREKIEQQEIIVCGSFLKSLL